MAAYPYNTTTWQHLRQAKLSSQPVCEACERRGVTRLAKAVDHVVAINKGGDAFPALDGLMSLCEACHNSKTARMDRGNSKGASRFKGCDVNGDPLDPEDEWLKPGGFAGPKALVQGPSRESKTELIANDSQEGWTSWV